MVGIYAKKCGGQITGAKLASREVTILAQSKIRAAEMDKTERCRCTAG